MLVPYAPSASSHFPGRAGPAARCGGTSAGDDGAEGERAVASAVSGTDNTRS